MCQYSDCLSIRSFFSLKIFSYYIVYTSHITVSRKSSFFRVDTIQRKEKQTERVRERESGFSRIECLNVIKLDLSFFFLCILVVRIFQYRHRHLNFYVSFHTHLILIDFVFPSFRVIISCVLCIQT